MATYTGELKSNMLSVRITDTAKRKLESVPGTSFSNKLDNLIMSKSGMQIEIECLYEELRSLKEEKRGLIREIQNLKEVKVEVDKIMKNINHINKNLEI